MGSVWVITTLSPIGTYPMLACQGEVGFVVFPAGKSDRVQDCFADEWDATVTGAETINEEVTRGCGVLIRRTCKVANMQGCRNTFSQVASYQVHHRHYDISGCTYGAGTLARQSVNCRYPDSAGAHTLT